MAINIKRNFISKQLGKIYLSFNNELSNKFYKDNAENREIEIINSVKNNEEKIKTYVNNLKNCDINDINDYVEYCKNRITLLSSATITNSTIRANLIKYEMDILLLKNACGYNIEKTVETTHQQ